MTDWPAALGEACREARTPGAALVVRLRGVEQIHTFGVADMGTGAPTTPETIFRLGSMTKLFTAVLAMDQIAEGRLSLDAPVRSMLPEFILGDEDAANTVKPRQLLQHRAGFFGDVLDGPSRCDDALRAYCLAGSRLEQVSPPGQQFSYCNAGFSILGRLTEVAAGRAWADIFVGALAAPLGMTRTGVRWAERPQRDVAACHMPDADGVLAPIRDEAENPALAPAGATPWSTPTDILTLGKALIGGGADGLALRRSVALMQDWSLGPTSTFATLWGLGLQGFDPPGRLFGHDGAVAGQQSFLRLSAEEDLVFALFVNGGDGRSVFLRLFAALEDDIGRPLATSVPEWPEVGEPFDAEPLVGEYQTARYGVTVSAASTQALTAVFAPTALAGDFSAPLTVEMRRQPGDPSGELFLTRIPPARSPTQQRFIQAPDGRRFLLFRGRLFPKIETSLQHSSDGV